MPSICSKNFAWAMVIALAPLTFGLVVNYPSPTSKEICELHGLESDSFLWATYNAISALCAILGPTVTNTFLRCFKNSRKKTVFVINCFGVVFWLGNCVTKWSIYGGIATRACLGVVMGAMSAIGPLYLVEIAPEGGEQNGFYGSLNQLFIVIGLLVSSLTGGAMDYLADNIDYLALNIEGAAVCFLQAIAIWCIPESPAVERLGLEIAKSMNEDDRSQTGASVFQGKYMKGLVTGVVMMIFQQFSGVNAIGTNLAELMSRSGLDINPNFQAAIAVSAQFIAVLVGALIVDKLGIKLVWIISSTGAMLSLSLYAVNDIMDWHPIIPLVAVFLYQFSFGIGLGPLPWLIVPDMFSDNVRATANTIVSSSNWLLAFAVILAWPAMQKAMHMYSGLFFFAGICFTSLLFGIFGVTNKATGQEGYGEI